jgi:hypothetical protein
MSNQTKLDFQSIHISLEMSESISQHSFKRGGETLMTHKNSIKIHTGPLATAFGPGQSSQISSLPELLDVSESMGIVGEGGIIRVTFAEFE